MGSEVLIIGGGIIGLSIARELVLQGVRDIIIFDRVSVGSESSWAAAGMLSPNIETVERDDFHRFGNQSLEMYPEFSASLRDSTGIDVELDRSGTLCVAFDEEDVRHLRKIYQQQKTAGVQVEPVDGPAIRELEPAISTGVSDGLFYPNDWQVENRKLLLALKQFVSDRGVKIVENSKVSELLVEGDRVTGARAGVDEYPADMTVVATGAWTSVIKIAGAAMPFHVKPIRGQMISFRANENVLRHVVYSPRGYVVPRADGRILVGATIEDVGFDRSTTRDAASNLRAAAVEIVPQLDDLRIAEHWSGLRPRADGLPVLGGIPGYDNVLVATAHYRNGILLAPLTARIVSHKIVGGIDSEYFRLFGAERFGSLVTNAVGG